MSTQTLASPARGRAPARARHYAPGIDGLRALAVLVVFGYHAGIPLFSGGFLGVDIFFVISGFLITDLLVTERHSIGFVDLRTFWVRRARRLLPALAVMVVVVTAAAELFDRTQLRGLRGDLIAAATYTSNWHEIGAHHSYFAKFGPQPMLVHLWSLAVEEQFYVVWPIAMLLLLRLVRLRGRRALVVLAGAIASTVAMALAYTPGGDPSRLYYGTDTHATGLLIGAGLALGLGRLRPRLDIAGWCCLAGLGLMIMLASDSGGFVYHGGFLLVSVLAAIVVAAAASPAGRFGDILGVAPLRWLGTRSYAIYLWHWPLLCLLHAQSSERLGRDVVALGISCAVAELSWRFVENPIRRDGLRATIRPLLTLRAASPGRLVFAAAAAVVLLVAAVGVVMPAPRDGAQAQIMAGEHLAMTRPHATTAPKTSVRHTGRKAPAGTGVTALGDSVMLASASALKSRLPGITISAQVGRQMSTANQIVATLRARHRLGSVVVIDLGTNGDFSTTTLQRLMSTIGSTRKVLLLTVFAPRDWQGQVNAAVRAAPRHWPNVTVVDWYSAIKSQPQLLWPDHVHPRPDGARLYAQIVTRALPAAVR